MNFDYKSFKTIFTENQIDNTVLIRFSKERNKQLIHKEIEISRVADQFFLTESERNKTEETSIVTTEKTELTEETLIKTHAHILTIFSVLNNPPPSKLKNWADFKASKHKIKWLTRFCFLDTKLVGGPIGKIIASVANKENPHYKTVASQILAKTLGPLIFPAGFKTPLLIQKGLILVDSVLHKQYKSLKNYNPHYTAVSGEETIHFENTPVSMELHNKTITLETITASNKSAEPMGKNHLHILYFNGNSGCFQQDYKLVAEDLIHYDRDGVAATAVQFNYPGVLNSEGQVIIAKDLIDAGIAQVQALLDKGVPHHKIVLHGVSLGGSIASHVAAHFHRQKMTGDRTKKQTLGGLYVSRTFASTAQVGRDFFNRALGDNIFSRLISTLCFPFIKLGTWGSEWNLDSGTSFFNLPRNKRDYSVVISSKAARKAYRKVNRGTKWKRFLNFILRRRINPVDDAILKRGLHDSWERRWNSFLIKLNFFNRKARKEHSSLKRSRKMVVTDLVTGKYSPDIDGHAKANYCSLNSKTAKWYSPIKEKKVTGLIHRASDKINIKDREAGATARRSIRKMAGILHDAV